MERPSPERAPTKVPFQTLHPNQRASITNPEHWSSYEDAVSALDSERGDGIGFVLGDGIFGIDLDHCRDDNSPTAWAQTVFGRVPTYAEVSPSGTGAHLIGKTDQPVTSIRVKGIELYGHDRYFTITGHRLHEKPVANCTEAVVQLGADLQRIRSFLSSGARAVVGPLWAGGQPEDQSAGDFALACRLLEFTRNDLDVSDRLFRLSGRMRSKWDEKRGETTYGRLTLEKAAAQGSAQEAPATTVLARIPAPISTAEWFASPPAPPHMLITGLLTANELNLVGGVARSGKSTLLLEAAACVAAGVPLFKNNAFHITTPGPTLYVFGEQGTSLWFARTKAVLTLRGLTPDLPLYFLDASGLALSDLRQTDALAAEIDRLKAQMVVIDSVSALFRLESQNDAAEVADKVRGPLQRLVHATGTAVVAVHHAAKITRKEEPLSAVDCLRGSDEFVAMAGGSVVGTWWSREHKAIKVMADVRAWGEARPFMVQFAAPPESEQPGTVDLSSPAIAALKWLSWWDEASLLTTPPEGRTTARAPKGPVFDPGDPEQTVQTVETGEVTAR